jgi:hypothetical protein
MYLKDYEGCTNMRTCVSVLDMPLEDAGVFVERGGGVGRLGTIRVVVMYMA